MKPFNALLLVKGFPMVSKVQQEALHFERSQHDKQTKKPKNLLSFIKGLVI
jgi:hypothetical protein